MNITQHRRIRPVPILGVALLAATSALFLAGPAHAAPGEGGDGTLTIHKLEQPAGGSLGPNDGSEIEISGATPLVAGFKACTVEGFDLANAGDWERIKNVKLSLDATGAPIAKEGDTTLTLDCGAEQMTAEADGTTVFDLAADAVYVVYESTPAANAIPSAEPTLITIPYPGNGESGSPAWNYSPHIYPKNAIVGGGATKDGRVIGDEVTFDITVPIAPLEAGVKYSEFRINDQLAEFLTYTKGSVVLLDADGGSVALTEGTDYTLTSPSGEGGVEVVLDVKGPGLEKLDANVGGQIVLTLQADATGTGSTENVAELTVNGKTVTGPEVVDPEEFFDGAHVLKHAKNKGSDTEVPLAGASFDIYSVGASATSCPAEPAADAELVVEGAVSGDDGKTPTEVLAAGLYCVYEVAAPSGYKPMAGGMLLEVDGDDAFVTVVNTQVGADEGDLPNLPITGAMGTVLLVLGGIALIAVATGLIIVRRRKANL
ncbi:MAG: SpaH/EbpB family LPXTG-anchored major pilin [Leucobacter sp.]|nr:SpaH/EbpB family LPXTG-anchored major pilin [Leucobacter sp.]